MLPHITLIIRERERERERENLGIADVCLCYLT